MDSGEELPLSSSVFKTMWAFRPCAPCSPPDSCSPQLKVRHGEWGKATQMVCLQWWVHTSPNAIKGQFYPRETVPTSCSPAGVNSLQQGLLFCSITLHTADISSPAAWAVAFPLWCFHDVVRIFGFAISCPRMAKRLSEKFVSHSVILRIIFLHFCILLNLTGQQEKLGKRGVGGKLFVIMLLRIYQIMLWRVELDYSLHDENKGLVQELVALEHFIIVHFNICT